MFWFISPDLNITMDKTLTNYIVKQNLIDKDVCDSIVEDIKNYEWKPHTWYTHHTQESHTYETKELDVSFDISEYLASSLNLFLSKSLSNYLTILNELISDPTGTGSFFNMVQYWSRCRLNRYTPGTMMRPHYDHIHSLFDGTQRGIPVLSAVGCLNDEYEGGEFIFYDDLKIELNAGDILIFPSNFLYPHRVDEVTSGTRYTFVSWAW
jgi:hypothetical protein